MTTELPRDAGPLTPAHYQELAAAEERAKKIRRAANVARFNGWCTAVFATISALFTVVGAMFDSFSITGLIVTLGLSAVAYNEFSGQKRLLKFEPAAATFLGWNQVGFLALIVGYCVWQLYVGLSTPIADQLKSSPEFQSLSSELGSQNAGAMGTIEDFVRLGVILVYGTVIFLSLIYQGWNALYYFGRRKYVEAYVSETPAWVLDLKRQTQ